MTLAEMLLSIVDAQTRSKAHVIESCLQKMSLDEIKALQKVEFSKEIKNAFYSLGFCIDLNCEGWFVSVHVLETYFLVEIKPM